MVLVANHPRPEALTEQCSLAFVKGVVLPGVGAVCAVESVREVLDATGDDRVVVRVQEAIRVQRDRVVAERRQQEVEEKDAIGIGLEEDGLVNGVRGVMEEPVRKRRAEDARHGITVRVVEPPTTRRANFRLTFETRLREPPPVSDTGRGGERRCRSGREALDEAVEALRARDMIEGKRADENRSVTQKLT
jgi:hypothetical protein